MRSLPRPLVFAAVAAVTLACWPGMQSPAQARVIASPLPAAGRLSGISCPSRSSCWAVGLISPGQSTSQLEMVHWNGLAWRSVPSPITGENVSAGQGPDALTSFTCPGKSSCWAAGSTSSRDLILHWNGTTWTVEWSQGYESLSAITCASALSCWAVGTRLAHTGSYQGARAAWFSVILHRTARGWSSVPSPDPARTSAEAGCTLPGGANCYSNQLSSVACAGTRLCWAVGTYMVQGQQGQRGPEDTGEILRWNGVRWSHVPTPASVGARDGLTTVGCSSKASCWVLGSSAGDPSHLVALFWNGTRWALVPSVTAPPLVANAGPSPRGRTTMSCRSTADCWVVGVRYPGMCGTTSYPIAVHWNGHAWSDMVGTLPAGVILLGVAVLTANDGWAVDGSQALVHWDGARWTAPPNQPAAGTATQGCGRLRQ
jgi:hypothetical protein